MQNSVPSITEWQGRITRPSTSHFNNVPVRGDKPSRCIASDLNQKFLLHGEHLVTLSGYSLHCQWYKSEKAMMEWHWQGKPEVLLTVTCVSACVSSTNSTLPILGSNPGLLGERLVTKIRQGTAPLEGLNSEECPSSFDPVYLRKYILQYNRWAPRVVTTVN